MSARSKARKRALDVLFAADVRGETQEQSLEAEALRAAARPERSSSWPYAREIVQGVIDAILRLPSQRREEAAIRSFAEDCLSFVGITEGWEREATTLPYGWQRRVEIARALATQPKLLLVDEIGAGLNPAELNVIAELLKKLSARGIAMIVVEHLLDFLNRITERVIVLGAGRMLFEGSLETASRDPEVIAAFIGAA